MGHKIIKLVIVVSSISLFVQGRSVSIQKCCAPDQVIDVNLMKCRDSGEKKWSPRLYPDESETGSDLEELSYEITTKIPRCPEGVGVHILPLQELAHHSVVAAKFRLLKSGRLVGKHSNGNWIDIPAESSCIDGIMNYGEPDDSNSYTGEEIDQAVITCPVLA